VTEIHDYMRLLWRVSVSVFARDRIADRAQTVSQMVDPR